MNDRIEARREIRSMRRFLRVRRFATAIVVGLAVLLFLMTNYVGSRHYIREDVSQAQLYRLSTTTAELLKRVTVPVDVFLLMENNHRHYSEIDNLLQEYAVANSRIRLTRVDPNWQRGRAIELIEAHSLQAKEAQVLFRSGDRVRSVTMDEVVLSTPTEVSDKVNPSVIEHVSNQIPVRRFNGEMAFSSAINEVINSDKAQVYVLQGHGERGAADYEAGGFAEMARRLESENIELLPLYPGTEENLSPDDCDLLLIPGARRRIAQPDLDLIDRYLGRKGRLLALVDSGTDSGIEKVLGKWGVTVSDDVVVEPGLRDLNTLPVPVYPAHPITRPLRGLGTIFFRPRSLRPSSEDEADGTITFDVLAASSEVSWRDVDYAAGLELDETRDEPGPAALAVAVEHGRAEGTALEPTRMVVIGDSRFAANGRRSGGADTLVVSAVNWLLDRDYAISVPSKSMQEMQIDLSAAARQRLMFIVMAGLPGCVGLLGALVWLRRRV